MKLSTAAQIVLPGIIKSRNLDPKLLLVKTGSDAMRYDWISVSYLNHKYLHGFSFDLSALPGCCGVIVSAHAITTGDLRGTGFGQELLKARITIAQMARYAIMLATTTLWNKVEAHILEKYGFEKIDAFTNPKTTNEVVMWKRNL